MVRIFVCMHVGLTTSFGCSKVLDMIYILRLGFVRLFCFLLHPLEFTALVYGVSGYWATFLYSLLALFVGTSCSKKREKDEERQIFKRRMQKREWKFTTTKGTMIVTRELGAQKRHFSLFTPFATIFLINITLYFTVIIP